MKKQTAVEWLVNIVEKISNLNHSTISKNEKIELYTRAIKTAKSMEQSHLLEAYRNGRTDEQSGIDKWHTRTALQYFNDTYNTDTP